MDILSSVKITLRISHDKLDSELTDLISAARAEMVRVGISPEKTIGENDKLIMDAVKTYCLMRYTTDMNKYDRYFESWKYQIDNLRKSRGYMKQSEGI